MTIQKKISNGVSEQGKLRASVLFPLLRHLGDVSVTLLQRHQLRSDPPYDPNDLIPLRAFLSLLEEAASVTGDPVLGARLGLAISPGEMGPAGLLMMQSSTLRRGLFRFSESISAVQSLTEMRFSEEGPSCGLAYQIDIEDAANWPQDAELTLSYTCSMIRQCFDRNWSPAEVHFMHEPSPRPDLLEQIFRAPVRFKQKFNRILIRPEELDLAYRIEDPELISVLNRHIADLILETSEKKSSYSERVRAVVARKIGRNPCTVESVACELGTTARSLQRYLMQEGTSWREILKQCRQKMIETHLAEKNMTMGELASTLGYADGTVLWRAFKQWTGQPPSRELKSLSSHKERGKEGNSSLN